MSFTGDLEHLPIVDVIQLLHSTRKTGTLYIRSHKGESQLVFNDGYFVSANHLNNSVRIGKVLMDLNLITQVDLVRALTIQNNAGADRKPLIATLIEQGIINKEDAYRGLETLIEMTIVEVLTWTSGTFELDVANAEVCDEYRYFPDKLHQEICLNVQSILMDALRIYDEKMRDGTLSDIFFPTEENTTEEDTAEEADAGTMITADLLGLDALETLDKKIPDVFMGLKDFSSGEEHRLVIDKELLDISHEERQLLSSFLNDRPRSALSEVPGNVVILFSGDNFLTQAITTLCNQEGLYVFTTHDEVGLNLIIEQSLSCDLHPVLILDAQHDWGIDDITRLTREKKNSFPYITVLLLVCSHQDYQISLRSLEAGVRAVFPRPCLQEQNSNYASGTITLLKSLCSYLKESLAVPEHQIEREFKACVDQLSSIKQPPEAAAILLRFSAAIFERSLTLVAGRNELIADKGVGIKGDKSTGVSQQLLFKIPLEQSSIFKKVMENQNIFYDECTDSVLTNYLFKEIGAPQNTKILLVPFVCRGKVISLSYADSGAKTVSPLQAELLDILSKFAGLTLEKALHDKKIENLIHKP